MSKKIVLWIMVVLWMAVIFMFSSENVRISDGRSMKAVEAIEKGIRGVTRGNLRINTPALNFAVRKAAHVSEYFIFALILLWAFTSVGLRGSKAFVPVFIIVFLFAASDEFHQLYVPGRTARLRDVLVDCIGAAAGMALFGLRKYYRIRIKPGKGKC